MTMVVMLSAQVIVFIAFSARRTLRWAGRTRRWLRSALIIFIGFWIIYSSVAMTIITWLINASCWIVAAQIVKWFVSSIIILQGYVCSIVAPIVAISLVSVSTWWTITTSFSFSFLSILMMHVSSRNETYILIPIILLTMRTIDELFLRWRAFSNNCIITVTIVSCVIIRSFSLVMALFNVWINMLLIILVIIYRIHFNLMVIINIFNYISVLIIHSFFNEARLLSCL